MHIKTTEDAKKGDHGFSIRRGLRGLNHRFHGIGDSFDNRGSLFIISVAREVDIAFSCYFLATDVDIVKDFDVIAYKTNRRNEDMAIIAIGQCGNDVFDLRAEPGFARVGGTLIGKHPINWPSVRR